MQLELQPARRRACLGAGFGDDVRWRAQDLARQRALHCEVRDDDAIAPVLAPCVEQLPAQPTLQHMPRGQTAKCVTPGLHQCLRHVPRAMPTLPALLPASMLLPGLPFAVSTLQKIAIKALHPPACTARPGNLALGLPHMDAGERACSMEGVASTTHAPTSSRCPVDFSSVMCLKLKGLFICIQAWQHQLLATFVPPAGPCALILLTACATVHHHGSRQQCCRGATMLACPSAQTAMKNWHRHNGCTSNSRSRPGQRRP